MKILEFQSESYQDWDAGLCSVIYTGNCNLRCPACHAGGLIKKERVYDSQEILRRLRNKSKFINKVVVCGGEPTLEKDLPDFLEGLKKIGLLVKLDTNGSNPEIVEDILKRQLVDYVAMDIKGPRELYPRLTGTNEDSGLVDKVERSMKVVSQRGKYEFRTTLFPVYATPGLNKDVRWMTSEEILKMCNWISGTIGTKDYKHFIQQFKARTKELMIDSRFSKEELAEEYHETPVLLMKEIVSRAKEQGYNLEVR